MKRTLLILFIAFSMVSFSQVSSEIKQDSGVEEFAISPNPAKNSLNIKLPSKNTDIKLEVFDVLGKRVYNGNLTQLESSINISNWKSGVYLVRVTSHKSTHTKRFIKQ